MAIYAWSNDQRTYKPGTIACTSSAAARHDMKVTGGPEKELREGFEICMLLLAAAASAAASSWLGFGSHAHPERTQWRRIARLIDSLPDIGRLHGDLVPFGLLLEWRGGSP
jgi:hypothetical protein